MRRERSRDLLCKLNTELSEVFSGRGKVISNKWDAVFEVVRYGCDISAFITYCFDGLPMNLKQKKWIKNNRIKMGGEERREVRGDKRDTLNVTLTIAVRGASQEFSKSWTRSWIQFETTLKQQNNVNQSIIKLSGYQMGTPHIQGVHGTPLPQLSPTFMKPILFFTQSGFKLDGTLLNLM